MTFTNESNLAFTVKDLVLTAYRLVPYSNDFVNVVGTLNLDTQSSVTEGFTISPGSDSDVKYYLNDTLTVDAVMDLLGDSSGIMLAISGANFEMGGEDFTMEMTNVAARTATIMLDYGPTVNKASEQYAVATKMYFNPDATSTDGMYSPVPLSEVLNILDISYETDIMNGNSGIVAINEIYTDAPNNKYWFIEHSYEEDGVPMYRVYAINECNYHLDDILVKTGDTIALFYNVDMDNDGLSANIESLFGSSDSSTDSDNDGWGDFKEVSKKGTDPADKDTDGDGINDKQDPEPLVVATSNDATLSEIVIIDGEEEASIKDYPAIPLLSDSGQYPWRVNSKKIRFKPTATSGSYSILISKHGETEQELIQEYVVSEETSGFFDVDLGANRYTLEVTSTDGSSKETYEFNIDSEIAGLENVFVSPIKNDGTRIRIGWTEPDSFANYDGFFIVRSTNSISGIPASDNQAYQVGDAFGSGTVVYIYDNLSAIKQIDDTVVQGTRYHYRLISYAYDETSNTYYFNKGENMAVSSADALEAVFDFNVFGILGVDENDAGAAGEYKWIIQAIVTENNSITDTISLAKIGSGDYEVFDGQYGWIFTQDQFEKASLTNGEVIVYKGDNLAEIKIDGYDTGTTYNDLLDELYNNVSTNQGDYCAQASSCYGKSNIFSVKMVDGNSVTLRIRLYEQDGDGWDPLQDQSYLFVYDAVDDRWNSTELSVNSSVTKNWSGSGQYMEAGKYYIFNPFYAHAKGDVQFFIHPSYTVPE